MTEKIRSMKGYVTADGKNAQKIPFEKLERKLLKMRQGGGDVSLHQTKEVIVDFFEGLTVGGRK